MKSSYARVTSPGSAAASFPAVRTSTFTACAALAASPGNSEVASVSAAPVPAPRPVWQYPQLRSQLCLHSQSGHRNASQAPRRAANASHRATGARSAHPESTKARPASGSSVTCGTPPKEIFSSAVGVEEESVTVNHEPGCVAAASESAAHAAMAAALTDKSAHACGTFATATLVGAATLS